MMENEIAPILLKNLSGKGITSLKLNDNNSIEVGVRKKISFFNLSLKIHLSVSVRNEMPVLFINHIEGLPWGVRSVAKFLMDTLHLMPHGIACVDGAYIVDINYFIQNKNFCVKISKINITSRKFTVDFSVV
jgi:hypothetical protein